MALKPVRVEIPDYFDTEKYPIPDNCGIGKVGTILCYYNKTTLDIIEVAEYWKRKKKSEAKPVCPECKGTGKYVGFTVIENCRACSKIN